MSVQALGDTVVHALPVRAADATLHVAFSGGLDSTVLLHLLASRGVPRVQAVHVHHGLQTMAEDWVAHCARVCEEQGVPLVLCRVQIAGAGGGMEAAAREARYDALRAQMVEGDVLATAHHQDDQAETVLLRLLRGTGPTGLAAMRPLIPFAPGQLWRPLLEVPRDELRAYAQTHRLRWIEDPQNARAEFARSYLRQDILPRLTTHWPAATRNLARAATLSAESADLLRELAEADLRSLDGSAASLPIPALKALTPARRSNLLRRWIEALALPIPFHDTLKRVDSAVLDAALDADPVLAWPGGEFRRYRDQLFAMATLSPVSAGFSRRWDGRAELSLPAGCGRLRGSDRAQQETLRVRLVEAGDRFRPAGSNRARRLKNLFQARGVPTWVRERTPVIECAGQVIWIGGIGCAADVTALDVEWIDAPPGAHRA